MIKEGKHNLTPQYIWRSRTDSDHWLYEDDKWTGLFVVIVTDLWVSSNKIVELKSPVYRITFSPYGDTSKGDILTDLPTLRQAQSLSEHYYKEWITEHKEGKK